MQTCNPSCVTEVPDQDWTKGCSIGTRLGGIPFLTFYKCDPSVTFPVDTGELSPWTDLDNVRYAICNNLLFITGELLGQKPKGSTTKRRISSCSPEVSVSGSKQITFQDFNASPDELIDFDFWQAILDNRNFLQVGWISCDDLWYQSEAKWDLDLDQVIEDNSETGKSFYDGAMTINQMSLIKPIKVAGLSDLIASFTKEVECYG